nr:TraI domain-containing protein [Pseudomonas syringae group genomosp. 7]
MGAYMLSFFTRRKASPISSNAAAGFFKPESPDALLSTSRRRQLIENIWQRTSLPREQFETLYMQAFKSYAALVQHLPASENHHHAYHGGMLDHGLEIVAYALKIQQMYLLPIGAPPESQAAQSETWSAASAYGALVHDLGKIAVDVKVELADGTIWHPWHGPLDQPYRFKYVKGPELTQEYILTHDLHPDTVKIYRAATKAYVSFFGECLACETTHRDMLEWHRSELARISKRSWNTYSSHLRTVFRYAMEHGLVELKVNPLKDTRVMPTKRPKKTIGNDVIVRARNWLRFLVQEELSTGKRSEITPAWFWLAVFETFYYTGIRLNALLCLRYENVDLGQRRIRVRGETEKTHREFMIPIPDGMMPHLVRVMDTAKKIGFSGTDQVFNINRFSGRYKREHMNSDQVEAMYKKLTNMTGTRMTPHRFRHTIASELMRQPERNIHITKNLLNHSNIATTMEYIELDYDLMREVINERGQQQAKINYLVRPVIPKGSGPAAGSAGSRLSLVSGTEPQPATTETSEAKKADDTVAERLELMSTAPLINVSNSTPVSGHNELVTSHEAKAQALSLISDGPEMEYGFGELEDIGRWISEKAAGEIVVQIAAEEDTATISEGKASIQLPDGYYRIPWSSGSVK